ncbi:integrase, catalytic region, zinc finger, CCHC-type containing protein [Tanacetum coccineum]|uniref:Integrase, catalytic region, zinc finger, CCHC-type containing protein n=1 Tax=Tanacetum coccineum TaxID=301880 RepID=A0ABQ4WPJ6_9ASTR
MTTLAEFMIVAGVENRPPMLDKAMYTSWESRMLLYIKGKKNGNMMLESIKNGPLFYPTIEVDSQIRKKKYTELTEQEQLQDDCDVQATNIVLQGLVVLVFLLGDDLIACLNKAMAFMSTIVASHFPLTNNQLYTSSNLRNQATIQDGRVTVQQVQGRQGQSSSLGTIGKVTTSRGNNAAGQVRVVKCYNCQGEGHMARQCTQPKRPRNVALFKEKLMLVEAQESGQVLDEELLAFLADPGITDSKVVLMANLSSYDSDVLSEDKVNQETKTVNESLTAELERYKERVKTLEQRFNVDLNNHEKLINSQMDDMIQNRCALKQEIDSLKHTLSNQVKDKESLLQTFNVFKKESEEKEKQAFWLPLLNPKSEQLDIIQTPVEIEIPKELSNINFENGLHIELNEVKTVFNQMEAAIKECSVDQKYFDIQKREVSLDND